MYTNLFKNQENLKKRFNYPTVCIKKDKYSQKTKTDRVVKYRGVGRKIYDLLYSFRNLDFIQLKNETIASKVGCNNRTVRRWTTRMVDEGLITKTQSHIFDVNEYTVILSKKESYQYYLNNLTPQALSELTAHGTTVGNDASTTFKYQTDLPIYSYINKYIYITNRYPLTRAHARETGCGFSKKQKERVVKGLRMLKKEQRDMIRKFSDQPEMAKVLENPEIKPYIITDDIQNVATLLNLSERERLKFVAFPEEVMKEVSEYITRFMQGKIRIYKKIDDRMGWAIGLANNLCDRKQLKPEWGWYLDLCKIMDIKPLEYGEPSRALEIPVYQSVPKRHDLNKKQEARPPMYLVHQPDERYTRTVEQEIDYLEQDIAHMRLVLQEPRKYFAFAVEENVKRSLKTIESHEKQLEHLRHAATA